MIRRRGLLLALPALIPVGSLMALPPPPPLHSFRAYWVRRDGSVRYARQFFYRLGQPTGDFSRPVPGYPLALPAFLPTNDAIELVTLRRTADGAYVPRSPGGIPGHPRPGVVARLLPQTAPAA